jgi:hypothetical protein
MDDDKSPEDKKKASDRGEKVLKFGLFIQLACFTIFAIIGVRFVLISRNWDVMGNRKWVTLSWAINGAATIIFVSVFEYLF